MARSKKEKAFHQELIAQLITLSTSGFGLVVALAWNEAVQAFVKEFIQAYFPALPPAGKLKDDLIILYF